MNVTISSLLMLQFISLFQKTSKYKLYGIIGRSKEKRFCRIFAKFQCIYVQCTCSNLSRLDSIAVSILLVELTHSDKIQITLLILGRGALSTRIRNSEFPTFTLNMIKLVYITKKGI